MTHERAIYILRNTEWYGTITDLAQVEMAITTLEDIEPVRRGRWIDHCGDALCSVCGYVLKGDYTNYCPNCGAKMEDFEEPEINPCRGCSDYDGKGGCKSNGACGAKMEDEE